MLLKQGHPPFGKLFESGVDFLLRLADGDCAKDFRLGRQTRAISEQIDYRYVLYDADMKRVGCLGLGTLHSFHCLSPSVPIGRGENRGLKIGTKVPDDDPLLCGSMAYSGIG